MIQIKTNKISAAILNLLVIISIFANFGIPIAAAASEDEVCAWMNNQVAKVPDPKINKTFEGKIAVVTEEPLGTADGKFSYRCARLATCTYTEGKADAKGITPPGSRKCETKYAPVKSCGSANPLEDLQKILAGKDPAYAKKDYITCEIVQIYLAGAGTDLLYQYVGQIYRYVAILGGSLAVLIMIVGGIMITTAGSNTEQIGKAKALITKCLSGLVLLFLSAVILYTINPNFFVR